MLVPLQGAAARFCCASVRVVCGLEAGVLVLLQGAAAGCCFSVTSKWRARFRAGLLVLVEGGCCLECWCESGVCALGQAQGTSKGCLHVRNLGAATGTAVRMRCAL